MKHILLGLVLCFALCSPEYAADSADEGKILALENAWNQAQLHHDDVALGQLIPGTFVNTDYDGTVSNKAQFLAEVKDPAYQASLVANQNVKVYSYGRAAVVTGAYHTKGKYKGKAFEHWGALPTCPTSFRTCTADASRTSAGRPSMGPIRGQFGGDHHAGAQDLRGNGDNAG